MKKPPTQPSKRRNVLTAWFAVFALLAVGLAACSSDDDTAAASDDPAAASDDDQGDPGDTLEVVAVDFAFEGLPSAIDAGTQLTLRNDATSELHELVAFRLDDDETRSIEEIMALPQEEMQQALGPAPTTVMLAPPASEQVAVPIGDGTLTEPGRYAIVCLIPTGVDADEYMAAAATSDGPPDVGDGPPHIVHGMYAEVEVR